MNHGKRGCQKAPTVIVAIGLAGCGANMQAVYESDVRFEHCMAFDIQPEMRDEVRRECWVEWVAYYTYGQTRDRVSHAELRIQQLSSRKRAVEAAAEH